MNDRPPYFDTSEFRSIAVQLAALTNPPAVEVLLAGAEGGTFLALASRS